MSKEKLSENNVLKIYRWKANHRYALHKIVEPKLGGFKSTEKSLTDKEAFRVSLASLRGTLASGMGSPTVGQYSLPAGKEYDYNFDFSYLNRPDISLVELHEFIENTRENLEGYDRDLQIKIKAELEKAESKAKEMEKAEVLKAEKKSD